MPPPSLSLRKKITFGFVTVIAFLAIPLLCAEFGSRLVMYVKHGVPGKSYGIYIGDDELGAVHKPNSYNSNSVINNWGLRNLEDVSPAKPPGSTRVYCSGGSTTFCYNLDTASAWPTILQKELRNETGHEKDEVLNAGEICFSISHEFALARRLLPKLKPDVVVLFTGINEGQQAEQYFNQSPGKLDELFNSKSWGLPATNLDQARFWKRSSTAVRLWDYYIKKWFEGVATASYHVETITERPMDHPSQHPYVMENLEHTLLKYIAFIREQGATPVILRYGDNGIEDWYKRFGLREWRERTVEIGRKEGVVICDVASAFEAHPQRKECFIASGVHVTELGAKVMAEELKKTILALPATPKSGSSQP